MEETFCFTFFMENLKTYRNTIVAAPVVLGPATLPSPRSVFEIYNLGPHFRLTG